MWIGHGILWKENASFGPWGQQPASIGLCCIGLRKFFEGEGFGGGGKWRGEASGLRVVGGVVEGRCMSYLGILC